MTIALTANGAGATEAIGEALGSQLQAGDVVVLTGDLGAGKTTMTKGIARALGVSERVTSPTFTIVQEYEGRIPVAHVDVYRLERIQELHDIGFEELLDGRVTVVEWGDAIARALPPDRLDVRIALVDSAADDCRAIEIASSGTSWAARRGALEAALSALGEA